MTPGPIWRTPIAGGVRSTPTTSSELTQVWSRAYGSAEPYRVDYRYVRPDGRSIWLREHAAPVLDETGVVLHWQGVLLDVTVERAAHDDLVRSEERHRRMLESLPAFVYVVTDEVDFTNLDTSIDGAAVMLGCDPDDERWRAMTWLDIVHPEDREAMRAAWRHAIATGEPFDEEFRQVDASGEMHLGPRPRRARPRRRRQPPPLAGHGDRRDRAGRGRTCRARRPASLHDDRGPAPDHRLRGGRRARARHLVLQPERPGGDRGERRRLPRRHVACSPTTCTPTIARRRARPGNGRGASGAGSTPSTGSCARTGRWCGSATPRSAYGSRGPTWRSGRA